jgi:single-stranded-DNA-specific exonuclease
MPVPMMKRWDIHDLIPPEVDILLAGYSPFMRQLLNNRGITDPELAEVYLRQQGALYDPFLLLGMDVLVERLWKAVDSKEKIVIYGDYDVDGVTAAVVLVQLLQRLEADVCAYIPDRFEEGYGLNKDALDRLFADGNQLVVTVDCGIRSLHEADHARRLGLDLVMTDHHEPGLVLPDAMVVICQKQPGDTYPDKNLSGVGLAYKIVQAMLAKRAVDGIEASDWVDLVAVGTVSDVVPLLGENRTLVKSGLKAIRNASRQGLFSLAQIAGLNIATLSARDIGFGLGPRLNAAGRLESALAAFDLLINTDVAVIGMLAQQLDDQNGIRQQMTKKLQIEAEIQIQQASEQFLIFAIFPEIDVNNPDVENGDRTERNITGVVGLAAGRLTELYYRPVVVGAQGRDFTRASCRSIPEFHITHALDQCADLLERHGGHAMAAGFTVRNENIEKLALRLQEIAREELGDLDLAPRMRADLDLPLGHLKGAGIRELLADIDQLEPCGERNPGAVFVTRDLEVVGFKRIGKDQSHLRLTVKTSGGIFDGIAFRMGDWGDHLKVGVKVDLLYGLERNFFNGVERLQLNVRDIHLVQSIDKAVFD